MAICHRRQETERGKDGRLGGKKFTEIYKSLTLGVTEARPGVWCMYGQCMCWRQGGGEVKMFQTSVESPSAEQDFKTCSSDTVFRCGWETKSCVWIERWKCSSNECLLRPACICLVKIHSNLRVLFFLFLFLLNLLEEILFFFPNADWNCCAQSAATVAVIVTDRRHLCVTSHTSLYAKIILNSGSDAVTAPKPKHISKAYLFSFLFFCLFA